MAITDIINATVITRKLLISKTVDIIFFFSLYLVFDKIMKNNDTQLEKQTTHGYTGVIYACLHLTWL